MPRVDVGQVLLGEVGGEGGVSVPFVKGERVVVCTAPGRLDVLGGLGAEAGGTLAQMALPGRVGVAVQLSDDAVVRVRSDGFGEVVSVPVEGGVVEGSWVGLVVGLYRAFAEERLGHLPERAGKGVVVRVVSGVPTGAGQGASTAMLAALVVGLCELHQVRMEAEEQALLIQKAEADGGGLRNGVVLDGMTSLVAQRGTMLRYSAQPHRLVGPVPVPPDLRVLAMETGVRSGNGRETLEELRLAGAMGLRIIDTIYTDLGQAHTPLHGWLANTSPLLYRQYFRTLLPKRMRGGDFLRTYGALAEGAGVLDAGRFYRVRTAVDHLLAENEHAEQFLQAMEELAEMPAWGEVEQQQERQRTLQRAGRLALASHHSYRLRLELSCAEADWLVDRLMEFGPERGIYGARITATGGGGTVMALVDRGSSASDAVLEVMQGYRGMFGVTLDVSEAGAAGALEVK